MSLQSNRALTSVADVPASGAADVALRLALARALIAAGERCMMLGGDRQPLRQADGSLLRLDLDRAVAIARPGMTPMAIPAPDVLSIDFDETDNPEQARRFSFLREELAAAGYLPLITASGRPGHQHLWCLLEDNDDRDRLFKLAQSLKLSLRAGRPIRLPLAPHAEGLPVRLLSPETSDGALRAVRRMGATPPLPGPTPQPVALHLVQDRPSVPSQPLGARPAEALAAGAMSAGYDTRHGADLGICLSAYQAGWSFEQLRAAYDDLRNVGGDKYRELGAKGFDYLRQTWAKAERTASSSPPVSDPLAAAELLSRWRNQALTQPWPGRSGATDLALYLAFIAAGLSAPSATLTPALSRQEMADAIGEWTGTVGRSLARLEAGQAVKVHEKGDRRKRSRWRVMPPPTAGVVSPLSFTTVGTVNECTHYARQVAPPDHDLFTSGGLQHNGWHLLISLCGTCPATATELAGRTGRDVKTVRGYLRRLASLNLAAAVDDGYIRADGDLDTAAAALGVQGAAAVRAAAGVAKRADWVARRDRRDIAVAKALRVDPTTGEIESPLPRPAASTTND